MILPASEEEKPAICGHFEISSMDMFDLVDITINIHFGDYFFLPSTFISAITSSSLQVRFANNPDYYD